MQRTGAMIMVTAMLLSATCGCGTMLNMNGKEKFDFGASDRASDDVYVLKYQRPPFPFGGIANDVAWINRANQPIDVIFSLVDMPFSVVGDIVTLPWAIHESLIVVRPNIKDDPWKNFWMESTPRAMPIDPAAAK